MKYAMAILVASLLAALPIEAHHSVAAEYDMSKIVTMHGVVTKLVWLNPHARFFLDVEDGPAKTAEWEIELPPPNTLRRYGWMRDDIKDGDRIQVDTWIAKDSSHHAHARGIILANGRVLRCDSCAGSGWDFVPKQR
jgi:hypothetical protein